MTLISSAYGASTIEEEGCRHWEFSSSKREHNIQGEDSGEQQPEEAATTMVPEVEDTEGGDLQELSANLKAEAELSLEADGATSLENDLSRSNVKDYSEKYWELLGNPIGTYGKLHGAFESASALSNDGADRAVEAD